MSGYFPHSGKTVDTIIQPSEKLSGAAFRVIPTGRRARAKVGPSKTVLAHSQASRIESFGLTSVVQSVDDFSVFRQGSFGQAKAAAIRTLCRLRLFPRPHECKPINPTRREC